MLHSESQTPQPFHPKTKNDLLYPAGQLSIESTGSGATNPDSVDHGLELRNSGRLNENNNYTRLRYMILCGMQFLSGNGQSPASIQYYVIWASLSKSTKDWSGKFSLAPLENYLTKKFGVVQ